MERETKIGIKMEMPTYFLPTILLIKTFVLERFLGDIITFLLISACQAKRYEYEAMMRMMRNRDVVLRRQRRFREHAKSGTSGTRRRDSSRRRVGWTGLNSWPAPIPCPSVACRG